MKKPENLKEINRSFELQAAGFESGSLNFTKEDYLKKTVDMLIKKIKAEGKNCPKIYMAIGNDDFLLENNREFHTFLESEGIEHIYAEDEGNHDMEFWNRYVLKFIPMMFE